MVECLDLSAIRFFEIERWTSLRTNPCFTQRQKNWHLCRLLYTLCPSSRCPTLPSGRWTYAAAWTIPGHPIFESRWPLVAFTHETPICLFSIQIGFKNVVPEPLYPVYMGHAVFHVAEGQYLCCSVWVEWGCSLYCLYLRYQETRCRVPILELFDLSLKIQIFGPS